jgi:hypothetical protein
MDVARRGCELRGGSIMGRSKFNNVANDTIIGSSMKFWHSSNVSMMNMLFKRHSWIQEPT